ncbi:MAG: hypothetical protein KKB13_10350, partial [Chloroflexi bacterium]|nr:hypothetical protein [Chloroflexota bacterium]
MNIVHIAPFGPGQAGIYEAARDMLRSDMLQGHDVAFVDAGAMVVGKDTREERRVGAIDERGGWRLETAPPEACNEADVVWLHTGCPDGWLVWNQAPILMAVHGTPHAAFRVEMQGRMASYSVYAKSSQWPRVKRMVYFWPEFRPYWDVLFPPGKSLVFDYPPIDRSRYGPDGDVWEIPGYQRGRYNGLICDSWREDSDILEITHAAIAAAERIQGLTWHIYAMPNEPGPFALLANKLRSLGALGTIGGRTPEFAEVYRGDRKSTR